jgi:hypothetical protein
MLFAMLLALPLPLVPIQISKVIIYQNERRGFLCHIRSRHAHGNADICLLYGRLNQP